jgi:2-polyprenyl-3-methyl-5-hydroxy-6-metoxy-1,4-benzoquinol methylase
MINVGDELVVQPCVLCGETGRKVVETRGRGFASLTTVICNGCGLVSHDPLPSEAEVDAFYAERYRLAYKGAMTPKRKHSLRAQRGAARRAARFAPLLQSGARVLDIGASSGEFVYAMSQLGFDAHGIEPNQGYAQWAIQTYGVHIENLPFRDALVEPGSFDFIHLNHVFEHLAEPLEALKMFRQWLSDDGLLFIEVPNLQGVQKQRRTLFHYAHIWNFSPHTFVSLMKKAGFAPIASENANSTSMVMAKSEPVLDSASFRNREHAQALIRQLHDDQSAVAYLTSGQPFVARWERLQRNIDELLTVRRFGCVKSMADFTLKSLPCPRQSHGLQSVKH